MPPKLTVLATAAILLPAAAFAQSTQQSQPPAQQPAAGTSASTADAKAQDDAKADSGATAAKPATKADVKAGATVYDAKGNEVGKIESVDSKGATLNTGKVKVTVPLKSFAHNDKGLVFGMSKAEVEAAASKSSSD